MFAEKELLLVPGPTPIPPQVQRAMMRPVINHRCPAYEELFAGLQEKLKRLFAVNGEVFVFPAAGTGMLEAIVVNFLSPNDPVLMVSIGWFGDRFGEIAERFGVNVTWLKLEWGTAATPEIVAKAMDETKKPFKAVLITHNETSTAVVNPVKDIAKVVKERGALLLVDAVSGLAAMPLPMDEWQIDAVAAASQKALMTPPGIGLVAVREEAWEAVEMAQMPRFYWDFRLARKFQSHNQNPYTPPVTLLYGLDAALDLIFDEGMDAFFERHKRVRDLLRNGIREMGLELFVPDDKIASCSLTAVKVPEGIHGGDLIRQLRNKYRIEVAGGQEHLRGKIIRISHMGYIHESDMLLALGALKSALKDLGWSRNCP
ncbi:MAG: alanine--glyoxylate aminotransferase family protein [Armatimonadetes bacterium]|nr:alanine--glyoxylate aminotransferase family protein [Armatimonadota bacterium]MDW8028477.1 alanine--glyoxylate aminotransferase family protein [Armatimonadota bacterium]